MIYRVDTSIERYDERKIAECLSWFPQERVDNVLKINHAQGRREKVAAYVLLVEMMRERSLLQELPLVGYAENGKPFLQNYPELHFNMSHCKRAVAVALHDAPVGIALVLIEMGILGLFIVAIPCSICSELPWKDDIIEWINNGKDR